jgi:hypothetical protein
VVDHVDPFLLLDEMGPIDVEPGEAKGAPDHPHRGFETVTYLLEGEMEHEDSAGNKGSLAAGDVQWMTAGSGVIHSEEPSRRMMKEGGRMHGLQLWVNLPASSKMTAPRYQDLRARDIPVVEVEGARVKVIAGAFRGVDGPPQTFVPTQYLHATVKPGAVLDVALPKGFRSMVYVLAGDAKIGAERRHGGAHQLVVLDDDGDAVTLRAGDAGVDAVVLSGKPLDEPVWRAGPFVLATREDLVKAFDDYHAGRFARIER